MEELALGRALTIALRRLVDDMHERLAADGFDDLRPAFGYVLNTAAASAMNASEIAAVLGMTKQGAAKLLTEMETAGYIARRDSAIDGRVRAVELTDHGRQALAAAARGNPPSNNTGHTSRPAATHRPCDECSAL